MATCSWQWWDYWTDCITGRPSTHQSAGNQKWWILLLQAYIRCATKAMTDMVYHQYDSFQSTRSRHMTITTVVWIAKASDIRVFLAWQGNSIVYWRPWPFEVQVRRGISTRRGEHSVVPYKFELEQIWAFAHNIQRATITISLWAVTGSRRNQRYNVVIPW